MSFARNLLYKLNAKRFLLLNKQKIICNAPFCNLYFDYRGNVYCCFANKINLGNYLNESVKSIWYGEKLNNIRKSIISKNLDYGCWYCGEKILKGDFSNVYATRYNYTTFKENTPFPTSLEFQLYNYCNSNCIMCVVSKEKSINVDLNKIKEILNELLPFLTDISFSGGEPFFINEYYELWEYIYRRNPEIIISVNTNGSVYNEKVKNILDKLKFNITVSIDSVNKYTYEKIRRGLNYDSVIDNLFKFKHYTELRGTFFNVKVCVLKENLCEMPEIFAFFSKNKINIVLNDVFYPLDYSIYTLDYDRLKFYYELLLKKNPFKDNINYIKWRELLRLIRYLIKINEYILRYENNLAHLRKYALKKIKFIETQEDYDIIEKEMKKYEQLLNKNELSDLYKLIIVLPLNRLIMELRIRNLDLLKVILEKKNEGYNFL